MVATFPPTLLENIMQALFNISWIATLIIPILLYQYVKNHPYRLSWRRILLTQWGLEAVLTVTLAVNILVAFQSGYSIGDILGRMSLYNAMITVYFILLFSFQFGVTYQFYRLLKKQRLTKPPPPPKSSLNLAQSDSKNLQR